MQEVRDDHTDRDLEMQQQLVSPQGDEGAKQLIHRAVQVVRSLSRVSSSKCTDDIRSPQQDEKCATRGEDTEEVAAGFVNADQTAPLLKTVDISVRSRKHIRTLAHVLRCSLAFKAHAAATASANIANVHSDNYGAIERKPKVAEASDSLSEHLINIEQPANHSQIEKFTKIVRQKDLLTLLDFGGLGGVEAALGTDLINGISNEEALRRQKELSSLSPTSTFLHIVGEEVMNKTVLLLLVAAALSIGFGIDEEGLQEGWTDGVVVLIAIVLQVFISSIHKYWKEQRARKKLQKQRLEEGSAREIHVVRGGKEEDIGESELVYGDLVFLKKGCRVPANGLFVDGEDLKLDYGSESFIASKHKPFLSYGETVITGEARMVVTSTNMMMKKATSDSTMRPKLETHLNKLNAFMHNNRIVISIFIIVVLFIRYLAGKIDDENAYKPESKDEPPGSRSFLHTFGKIIKESKYTRALTKLLSVSLVGLAEGVPFVVSLAIVYWNEETLSSKATTRDSYGILRMSSVTKICTDTFGEFNEDDPEVQKLVIGGEFFSEGRTLSPNVVEALCDGTDISKENAYLHGAKYKFGLNMDKMQQSEEIISKCTHYYNVQGEKVPMNDTIRRDFHQANNDMECMHKLKTVAVACKHMTEDWILVALLGLENKNIEATKAAVNACRECGIGIIIVSHKKLPVLKDIVHQYGLETNDDQQSSVLLTGEDFRKYTDKERLEKADTIRVVGEAVSSDKLLLVETWRENGDVVALLGQRTDEVPALIEADIGIAMGRRSSEKARRSSDIILRDGSISEIISMVDSAKFIHINVQSFLQPVLITTISSSLINFIQTTAWGDASLTITQSVWVNLGVVFLGGFALLTKPSADKPVNFFPGLITAQMTRNILLQVSYQITCLLIIQTKGAGFVGSSDQSIKAVVSNTFIICQFFNLFNARELQKKNFFRCIHRHKMFLLATTAFLVLHSSFVAAQDIFGYGTRLNWKLWVGCVLVGVLSWVVDWLGKCISGFILQHFV